jgi:hypothetical protein
VPSPCRRARDGEGATKAQIPGAVGLVEAARFWAGRFSLESLNLSCYPAYTPLDNPPTNMYSFMYIRANPFVFYVGGTNAT